jgi:hypothetical protein
MAITTYAQLQASVISWLHRADLSAQVLDFISLAESEINTDMRLRLMEVDESVTLLSGARTVALPSRFLEPIKLELVFTGRENEELTYLTPQQMNNDASTGARYQPEFWTVNGDTITFPNSADQNYTLTFRMLKGLDIASTTTNALLTAYPGIYLYGTLLQAQAYMVNDMRISTWANMYSNLVKKANRQEARTKTLATLRSDHPSARQGRSNIFRG